MQQSPFPWSQAHWILLASRQHPHAHVTLRRLPFASFNRPRCRGFPDFHLYVPFRSFTALSLVVDMMGRGRHGESGSPPLWTRSASPCLAGTRRFRCFPPRCRALCALRFRRTMPNSRLRISLLVPRTTPVWSSHSFWTSFSHWWCIVKCRRCHKDRRWAACRSSWWLSWNERVVATLSRFCRWLRRVALASSSK